MKTNYLNLVLITLLLCCVATSVKAQSKLMAKQYAQAAAERLMKSISPNTGKNASAEVYEAEWDSGNDRYIIEMEASWRAGQCGLCDEEDFVVRGILKVGKNGDSPSFKETHKNSAVRGAWSDKQVGAIFAGVATLAAASSSSSSKGSSYSSSSGSKTGYVYIRNTVSTTMSFSLSCDGYSYSSYTLSSYSKDSYRCGGNVVHIRVLTYTNGYECCRVEYKLEPNSSYKISYNSEKGCYDVYYD
jgi:hypothetical protein